jgi:hypothetical protein
MKLDILKELDNKYGLVNLYKSNIINAKVIFHKDVYEKFDTFIRMGDGVRKAVYKTESYFKIDSRSVYRIIQEFKNDRQ